jgi:hypothetical protein
MESNETSKEEQAKKALQDYLEYADLQNTIVALRNLIFRYVEGNEGHELWFEEFKAEWHGLFGFFDTLQFIYPRNENWYPMSRNRKYKMMSEATPEGTPETTLRPKPEITPIAAPETSPQTTSETPLEAILERKERGLRLSARLREQFYEFVTSTSTSRLNRLSRDMLLAYFKDDPDSAARFFESKDYWDLQQLFYLFEIIDDEYTGEE